MSDDNIHTIPHHDPPEDGEWSTQEEPVIHDRDRDPVEVVDDYMGAALDNLTLLLVHLLLSDEEKAIFVENLKEAIAFSLDKEEEDLDPEAFEIVERFFRGTLLDDDRPRLTLIRPGKKGPNGERD